MHSGAASSDQVRAKRVLVALGGNAIKKPGERGTADEQLRNVEITCRQLLKLVERGYELVLTHGNGPQVGNLLIQHETAKHLVPAQPLDVLVAMTQGQIGFMFQQVLENSLRLSGIAKPVVTVVTQVLVDKNDPGFKQPSKPIGPFYGKGEIGRLMNTGYMFKKVMPGKGASYRRVVPSPDVVKIVESEAIRRMLDAGILVIASGGGGIPVTLEDGCLQGIEAVIDKDLASERLAEEVNADILLVLTDVDSVKLNFGRQDEKPIDRMTAKEARRYLAEGHFLPGSMGPKVLACIRFVEWGGKKAIITSLDKAIEALEGRAGTLIYSS